jgi:hypothetical protein
MTALSKFLVLLAIFLLANLGDAFINLSSVAGNLVRVNHWIQFVESMSKPKNEPTREPRCEPTTDKINDQTIKGLKLVALHPVNQSSK